MATAPTTARPAAFKPRRSAAAVKVAAPTPAPVAVPEVEVVEAGTGREPVWLVRVVESPPKLKMGLVEALPVTEAVECQPLPVELYG